MLVFVFAVVVTCMTAAQWVAITRVWQVKGYIPSFQVISSHMLTQLAIKLRVSMAICWYKSWDRWSCFQWGMQQLEYKNTLHRSLFLAITHMFYIYTYANILLHQWENVPGIIVLYLLLVMVIVLTQARMMTVHWWLNCVWWWLLPGILARVVSVK